MSPAYKALSLAFISLALTAACGDSGDSNNGSDAGDSSNGSDAGDSSNGSDAGDSNNGSDAGVSAPSPDVSKSTLLNDLTAAEAKSLCDYEESVYKGSLPEESVYCILYDAYPRITEANCEAAAQKCKDEGALASDKSEDWGCDSASAAFFTGTQGCTANVGEWLDCLHASESFYAELGKNASCSDIGDSPLWSQLPPACASLYDKCPDVDL